MKTQRRGTKKRSDQHATSEDLAAARKVSPVSDLSATNNSLIKLCVSYAQNLAAYQGGFKADPDEDSRYATVRGDKYYAQAERALAEAASLSATTAMELDAKARIVPLVLQDAGGFLHQHTSAFLESLATDAHAFMEKIIILDYKEKSVRDG